MKQHVKVFTEDDPFDQKIITINTKKGEKILSTSVDALNMYNLYSDFFKENKFTDHKKTMDGDYSTSAVVSKISNDLAYLESNSKETLILNMKKEENRYLSDIQVGNNLKVYVKPRLGNNSLEASYSSWIKNNKIKEIVDSIKDENVAYQATVKSLIHGGYYLDLDGIEVFMPGSLGGINKLHDFEMLIGKTLIVMPVNYSDEKNTIVVSHRKYLKTLIPSAIDDLKEDLNAELIGHVTGTVKSGVFVEFNDCLTGLISDTDLDDETMLKFKSRDIRPGEKIKFKVKQVISNKKIILTQKESLSDTWNNVTTEFALQSVVDGKITKITKYGAFIEIKKGIFGLIYDTNISSFNLEEGQTVKVKIDKIDSENKKINLILIT